MAHQSRRIAYIQDDRSYTFQEIGELSCRIANGLIAAGFAKEAKAAVWADNDVIGWSCALGMWRAGLAYIPVNGRNAVAENQYVLDAFDCEVLFFHQAFASAIDALRSSLPKIRLWVCLDADLPWAPSLASWSERQPATLPAVEYAMDDVVALSATGRHDRCAEGRDEHAPLAADVFRAIHDRDDVRRGAAGESRRGADDAHRRHDVAAVHGARRHRGRAAEADPALLLGAIVKHRVTEFFLPPTVIYRLLDIPGIDQVDFSSLRYFLYGAAPMSVESSSARSTCSAR